MAALNVQSLTTLIGIIGLLMHMSMSFWRVERRETLGLSTPVPLAKPNSVA